MQCTSPTQPIPLRRAKNAMEFDEVCDTDVEYGDNARNAGKRALPIDLRGGGQPELAPGW